MSKKYFIGFTLPKSLSEDVDTYRKRFAPNSLKKHPPHITLVEPFEISKVTTKTIKTGDDLVAQVHRVYTDMRPQGGFVLQIVGVESFSGQTTKHLKIASSPELISFRDKLYDVMGLSPTFPEFNPHITVAKLPEKEEINLGSLLAGKEFNPAGLQVFNKRDDELWWKATEVTY